MGHVELYVIFGRVLVDIMMGMGGIFVGIGGYWCIIFVRPPNINAIISNKTSFSQHSTLNERGIGVAKAAAIIVLRSEWSCPEPSGGQNHRPRPPAGLLEFYPMRRLIQVTHA